MALDQYALVSLDRLKSYLGIPVSYTEKDLVLEDIINASSAKIESFIDRKVLSRQYSEIQDGRGTDRIVTRQYPLQQTLEIWDDVTGMFSDQNNKIDPALTAIEGDGIGIVLLGKRRFSKGVMNIKIVYEAGYNSVPYDLEQACIFTCEYMYEVRSDRAIRTTSKSKSGESESYSDNLPQFVVDMILPYQRMDFGLGSIAVQGG